MRDFEPPLGLKFLVDHCEILWCSGGMESRRFFVLSCDGLLGIGMSLPCIFLPDQGPHSATERIPINMRHFSQLLVTFLIEIDRLIMLSSFQFCGHIIDCTPVHYKHIYLHKYH